MGRRITKLGWFMILLLSAALTACGTPDPAIENSANQQVTSEVESQVTMSVTSEAEEPRDFATATEAEASTSESETESETLALLAQITNSATSIQSASIEIIEAKKAADEEAARLAEEEKKAAEEEAARLAEEAKKPKNVPGIICWGDSLTYGYNGNGTSYPGTLKTLLDANGYGDIKVVNVGSSGETSISIAARSGGIPLTLSTDINVSGAAGALNVLNLNAGGREVNLSIATDTGINPCTLGGIDGTFYNGAIGTGELSYIFTRNSDGDNSYLTAGTALVPYSATHYKDYVSIIFIGTNGGYNDFTDLINQQNAIINSRSSNRDKYLIIGMFYPPGGYNDTMAATYGRHFLNFGEYCGGTIPANYKSDEIHLNAEGYAALGQAVYERLVELGSLKR